MLLGCCHCEQEESQPSIQLPSVDTPSILNPSESATSIFGQPGFCGACYNMPGRWRVGTKGDWFVFNPNWQLAQVDDCPIVPTYVYRTLYLSELSGLYSGMSPGAWGFSRTHGGGDYCAYWKTDTKAVELSSNACDPSTPIYAPCGPNDYNIPLMEIVASKTGSTGTIFHLFYWWSICGYQFGYAWEWQVFRVTPPAWVSCVRTFDATFKSYAGPITGGPYALSTTDTSWGTVVVEPA